jgi:HAMP domain-containing protein
MMPHPLSSTRGQVDNDRCMRNFRQRLSFTLLAWLALILTGFSMTVFLLVRQTLRSDVDQYVRDKAFILGYQVNPAYPTGIFPDQRPWTSDRYFGFGQAFDSNWNSFYKSTRLPPNIESATEEVRRYAEHWLGVAHHDTVGPDGTRYRMATVRIERNRKFVCYAQYGILTAERDAPLRALIPWLGGGSVVALLLGWFGLDFLVRQWSRRLESLSEAARQINLGNLSRQRVFVPADAPELGQLAASFNRPR